MATLHMVSWLSACKNPVAIRDGCRDQCCRDDKKISQWADITCERMLFLAALILLSRVEQTRLVSLFLWIGRSTSIFHGSVDLDKYPVNEFVKHFWCDIYSTMNCLFPKYWLLCHWGGRDKCGQYDHPGQHQVSSSEFQHRADHVSPPRLYGTTWLEVRSHLMMLAGISKCSHFSFVLTL